MAVTYMPPDENLVDDLKEFSKINPDTTLVRLFFDGKDENDFSIDNPWSDQSLTLFIVESKRKAMIEILSRTKFPRLLSAIQDTKSNILEVIWTAYELQPNRYEVISREFIFEFKGKEHHCRFGAASDDLMLIASTAIFRRSSETNFRNIQSLKAYSSRSDGKSPEQRTFDTPRSFYIDNFDLNEEETVEFVRHLNFYMTYYDSQTPTIVLHLNLDSKKSSLRFERYVRGNFPHKIKARELDATLLSFWSATQTANPMMDFIICYRIIEYTSIHFVDEEVRSKLKRILSSPHFGNDVGRDIEEIAFVANVRLEDYVRLKHLIKKNVDPFILWPDIEANRQFFPKDVIFDGGYIMKALINSKDSREQFASHGFHSVADAIRKLRNALSHGKDVETAGVVLPTLKNFELLKPMLQLITIIAGQVILYKDVT